MIFFLCDGLLYMSRVPCSSFGPDEPCAICRTTLDPACASYVQECKHRFCFSCIYQWAAINNSCPKCRVSFHTILKPQPAPDKCKPRTRLSDKPFLKVCVSDAEPAEERNSGTDSDSDADWNEDEADNTEEVWDSQWRAYKLPPSPRRRITG